MARQRLIIPLWALGAALLVTACASQGSGLFRSEGCINCHRFRGEGGNIGPDLTGVTDRRSEEWIARQIHNSKEHNPDSRMPNFSHLSWWQVRSLIKYLKSQ